MYLPTFIIFPKIFKKKSYYLKINMKNSKIDRRTKILFVLHGENPKGWPKKCCPKVIINIFYNFFPNVSTFLYQLPSTLLQNSYLYRVNTQSNMLWDSLSLYLNLYMRLRTRAGPWGILYLTHKGLLCSYFGKPIKGFIKLW